MKLQELHVRRLHDLGAFRVDGLSPALNLVVGPNGSGKSSLMQAVRATLWGAPALPHAELVTVWEDGRGACRAELVGDAPRWQRAGAAVPAPEVPDAALASNWTVGLLDLLAAGHTEAELVARVRRQMAGGYDLHALEAQFRLPRSFAGRERAALDTAVAALNALDRRRQDAARGEDRLADLRRDLEAARAAERLCVDLRQALELADVRTELAVVRPRLAEFPAVIEGATDDVLRRLDEYRRDLEQARRGVEARRMELRQAEAEAGATRLNAPADEAELNVARGLARRTRDLEVEAADARAAADAAREVLERKRRTLDPGLAAAAGDAFLPDLDAVEGWAGRMLASRGSADAVGGQARLLERQLRELAAPSEPEVRRLQLAEAVLVQWAAPRPASRMPAWLWGLALGLAALGAAGAFLVAAWGVALVGLGAGLLLGRRLAASGGDGAENVGAGWPAEVEPPASWQAEAVRARLDEVRDRLQDGRRAQALRDELGRLRDALAAAQARIEALQVERAALCGGLVLETSAGDLRLADLLTRLREGREAAASSLEAEALARAAEAKARQAREALAAALERLGLSGRTATEAEALLDDLQARSARLRTAVSRRETLQAELESHASRAADLEARLDGLFEAFGLGGRTAEDARAWLERLVGRRPAWEALRTELDRLAHRAAELEAALAERPDLLALEREVLETQLDSALEHADRRETIVAEIAGIQTALDLERGSLEHEEASAGARRAREALAAARARRLEHEAAGFLIEDVRAAHAEQQLPQVFKRAAALFARFTHGRYDLTLDGLEGGTPQLRAVDTTAPGRPGLDLERLSDGTRMQLLLATRVAFAAGQENGRVLPLFLDESLTATDPGRFEAVARALLEVAAEGRQLFYLTSDPADVARWQQACARHGAAAPAVFDLARIRGEAAMLSPRELELPGRRRVPAPDGRDAAAYGRLLQVPRFQPLDGADSVHLFHLFRGDLPLLHRLLDELQAERLGPLRGLMAATGDGLLAAGDRARIEAAGRIADAFAEAWSEGRGRPVDREALAGCPAVSATFLDRLAELAAELQGDGRRLLEALEEGQAKRFRGAAREELGQWLAEHGHLDDRPCLTGPEILARCRAAAAADVAGGVLDGPAVAELVRGLEASLGWVGADDPGARLGGR